MLHSLRWRLVVAFGLVIALTLFLSGGLVYALTANRFQVLVSEEGQLRAAQIAPILEASYTYRGDWSGLPELLAQAALPHQSNPETDLTMESSSYDWYSDVDWISVITATTGISLEALGEPKYQVPTLWEGLRQAGFDPQTILDIILAAESAAADQAVIDGLLTSEQRGEYLANIRNEILTFMNDGWYLSCEGVAAEQLGMTSEEILERSESIAALAEQQGVQPEKIVSAMINARVAQLRSSARQNESDIALELAGLRVYMWNCIDPEGDYHSPYGPSGLYMGVIKGSGYWLVNTIIAGDERLVVADAQGRVVYDSVSFFQLGQHLAKDWLDQGVPLYDNLLQMQIGTAIVAAGPGYYTAQQAAFLRGVSLSFVVGGFLSGAVALIVGLIIARRVTAPVSALTAATSQIAAGKWETRIPMYADDELGQMSAAFNQMASALEAQSALRTRLVDDIAHEISTPLSVIQLELQALRDDIQSPAEASEHVEREVALLRDLLDDLTLLAETDAGSLQLHCEPINLAEATAQAIARWRPKAEAADVRLIWNLPHSLPTLRADRLRLSQVLGNLLSNAITHTPPQGRVEVRCYAAGDRLITVVQDTGEGISADDLPHVFERFYRADRSRSRVTGGRGLGLPIVRQIIEAHGGEVWIESEPGEGTTCSYSLPLG